MVIALPYASRILSSLISVDTRIRCPVPGSPAASNSDKAKCLSSIIARYFSLSVKVLFISRYTFSFTLYKSVFCPVAGYPTTRSMVSA